MEQISATAVIALTDLMARLLMSSPTALWLLAVTLVIVAVCFISCGIPSPWSSAQ